jgi:hypothetical protein
MIKRNVMINTYFFAGIITFCFILTTHAAYEPAMDFDSLYHMHLKYVVQYADDIESQSKSGEGYTYYNTSYYLHGMLSAVEATKDESLLVKVIHYCDNMLDAAEDYNGDTHLEWQPMTNHATYGLMPNQLTTYQGSGPIARAAEVIMSDPDFKVKYESDAQRYFNFLYGSIIEYWHIGIYNSQIPWLPSDLGGWGSYTLWSDKCSHLARIATSLYKAFGDSICHDIATRVAEGFRRELEENGQGWIWDSDAVLGDFDSRNTVPYHDVSHANREPMMMVFMHEAAIEFTKPDLERMAATLTEIIWNGSLDAPLFSNYINGSNADYNNCGNSGCVGNVYSGWALLARYSEKAHQALSYTLKAIDGGKSIGQNNSSYGKIALSGHLLRSQIGTGSAIDFTGPMTKKGRVSEKPIIRIFNIQGKLVDQFIPDNLAVQFHWYPKGQAAGIYIIQSINGKKSYTKTILR